MIVSKNGAGIAVFLMSVIGISITESDMITTIFTIGQIVSGILIAWNQATRTDVRGFLFK